MTTRIKTFIQTSGMGMLRLAPLQRFRSHERLASHPRWRKPGTIMRRLSRTRTWLRASRPG